MKQFKNIIKIIARLLIKLNSEEHHEKGVEFGKNIMENVLIAQEIAGDILKEFQVDTDFRSRGIDNALAREIADELEHEA
jgi:hypothetical protein